MRIYATVSDRTARRSFREQKRRKRPLTMLDHTLPAFGFTVTADDTGTYFVRAVPKLGAANIALGKTTETTADEARVKAVAEIEAAQVERKAGPLMRDFAEEFIRRRAHRWKPSTRKSNLHLLKHYILPPLGGIRVAEMTRADVRRWFDSLSGTPGVANRTLPVLSAMITAAELWDIRPQGSNPCRNMRRYRIVPRARFLSADELKRLGFVLDHAEDRQAAAAIRLLLFTGARSSEIVGLRWDCGYARPVRCCPTRKRGRRRSSFPRPRGPCSRACRAIPRSSSPTGRATGRWPTSPSAGSSCALWPGWRTCAFTTADTVLLATRDIQCPSVL